MYKVVEFDDGIMAVPTKWVDVNRNVCKWPPYENNKIEEAIKDNEDVGRHWSELPIRGVFGKAVGKVPLNIVYCKHMYLFTCIFKKY